MSFNSDAGAPISLQTFDLQAFQRMDIWPFIVHITDVQHLHCYVDADNSSELEASFKQHILACSTGLVLVIAVLPVAEPFFEIYIVDHKIGPHTRPHHFHVRSCGLHNEPRRHSVSRRCCCPDRRGMHRAKFRQTHS